MSGFLNGKSLIVACRVKKNPTYTKKLNVGLKKTRKNKCYVGGNSTFVVACRVNENMKICKSGFFGFDFSHVGFLQSYILNVGLIERASDECRVFIPCHFACRV